MKEKQLGFARSVFKLLEEFKHGFLKRSEYEG